MKRVKEKLQKIVKVRRSESSKTYSDRLGERKNLTYKILHHKLRLQTSK